jgi:hypothetical protein
MNTTQHPTALPRELVLAEQLTALLDDFIRIPVLGIRVGLDPILGLVPVVGDLISAGTSLLILSAFIRHGVPKRLIARMVLNILLDLALGAVPVVGDLFDVFFKANRRNMRMAREYFAGN